MSRPQTRKIFSLFSIFLLSISLIMPSQAFALQAEPRNEDIDEDAMEILKELEAESHKENEESQENTNNEEQTTSVIADVPSLTEGLNFDEEPAYDEDNFVLDGIVESEIVQKFKETKTVDVIIRLKDKVDMNELSKSALSLDAKTDRAEYVVDSLQSKSELSQVDLLQTLKQMETTGVASNVKSFWVFNGVAASITEDALEKLAARDDVERITLDAVIHAPDFSPEESEPNLPAYGVEKINAPKVWGEYDYRGEGMVVGIMDSGVQGDHEALRDNYRGRNGDDKSSWIDVSGDNYDVPTDGLGHGTHVAGSAVGGGEGEPIGVAPDAEWIAAKTFADDGRALTSGLHEAFEWFMAPGGDPDKAPDVVNNSWGNSNTYQTEFLEDVKAWVAAGIFPLFAAGNDGPGGQTIGAPASFPEAFSIGATDRHDQIAPFSSRGPVFWQDEQGVEKRYIKPEVSAPGADIYSALPNGGYGLNSGTSMATPHVAGAIALIKGNDPNITDAEVMDLLENTARVGEHMGSVPNDDYGSGVVDVYRAVTESAYAGQLMGTLTDHEGDPIAGELYIEEEDLLIEVDEDGTYDVRIREGEYEVEVSSFGYKTKVDTIEIVKDDVLEKNWALDIAVRHDVSGTVSFSNDEPAALVSVRVKDTPLETVRTDEEGTFYLPEIPEGTFTLVFSGQGIRSVSKEINVTDDLTVNVQVEQNHIDAADDWKTSRNNYGRNAITEAEVSAENLKLDWSVNASPGMLFNSPVIAEGKIVYVSDAGKISVVDQKTGEEDWSLRTGLSNRSTPTVEDGVIYVGGGGDFNLHAISLETGLKKWSKQLDYPAVYETPVVKDGVIYISSYMNANAVALALDAETGDLIWEQDIGVGSFFGPAMGNNTLFVTSYDSRELYALSPDDGTVQWHTQLTEEEGFSSSPVYADGILYANTNHLDKGIGSLRAFDATSGEELWRVKDTGNSEAGAPIVFDDLVIAGSKSQPMIRAYDKTTGDLVWEVENGSPMSNSGAISGNGNLFITDASANLKVYDAYTGERLASYGLNNPSIAGVAITDGQVVVADNGSLYSFIAPGKLTGTITDEDGNPLRATISIPETGQSTETDENGEYSLEENPGTYEVKVAVYGYNQVVEEIRFVSGYERDKSYELFQVDSGSFSGEVTDKVTGESLEGVTISIKGSNLESTTNSDGSFAFPEVYEGTYDVELSYSGYSDKIVPVTIEVGENTDKSLTMQPVEVAVLHDYEGDIVRFLNNNHIVAEERGWEVMDDIGDYEVIVLNGAYTSDGKKPTEEQINEIITAAKDADVSLLFAGTWGPSYGSLRYLAEHTGDPAKYDSEMGSGETVQLRVERSHPIFAGLEEDSTHMTIDRNYLAWFNQYSGQTIGSAGISDQGIVGSSVAYKGVTEDSAHLLMSSHAASPWVSPYLGWTSVQQQIYLNGINYLLDDDLQFAEVSGTVLDSDENPLEDVTITVEDTGYTVETDENGAYGLFHDDGIYEVSFRKNGYGTQKVNIEFINGEPQEVNQVLTLSNDGTISGQVVNTVTGQEVPYAEITVYDANDEEVTTEVSSQNGNYEITGLDEATYTLEVRESGFVVYENTIDVGSEPTSLDIELYPVPSLGIIGDSSIRGLAAAMEEKGIQATNYSEMEDIIPEISDFDVIFFNSEGLQDRKKETLEELLVEADKHEVSIIFGDEYYTGSGLNHLVEHLNDPEERIRVRDKNASAGYVITEENPIFGNAQEDDFVRILNPSGSSISAFEDYTGYPLADIIHEGNDEVHGEGVAYKPRTGGSMELLMGGHGISVAHRSDDYTDEGMEMFLNAILWSAFIEYNAIEGVVTDEDGNPLDATVELVGHGMEKNTDLETGEFIIGSIDGEFEIEVTSFGYDTYTTTVTVDDNIEPMTIEMTPSGDVGSITGTIIDEKTHQGIEDAKINVEGYPREATTDVSGSFTINNLKPGDYELTIEKENYVIKEIDVTIEANEAVTVDEEMKPTPTIGVIVDSQSSSAMSLDDYLTPRGYEVEEFYYTDLDRIENVDLVFANSDYDNSLIPEEDDFVDFLKELDRTETPVVWTGNNGPRGSIRFLEDYEGDPEIEHVGRLSSDDELTATVTEDHPILDRVILDDNNQFIFPSSYYGGFEGYTGTTIADVMSEETGEIGAMIGYGGRTLNSNEVLLETMTFGYGFTDKYFDKNREKIVNNAITWLLDDQDALVGEIHGHVTNNLEGNVFASITVEETGKTFTTEEDGSFFLALDDGTYTLNMEAFGHEAEDFEVTVERGEVLDKTFTMTADNAGTISGEISSESSGESIEGAKVSLESTPITVTSDSDGTYEVQAPAGEYQARITAEGYAPKVVDIEIVAGETSTVDISLADSERIAFLGKSVNADRALPFLEEQGYETDFFESGELDVLMDELAAYPLVIWNDNSASEAEFKQFIDEANDQAVSIVFASQYNNGTIRDLNNFYGDPADETSSFAAKHVEYKVLEDHPIFSGYEKGDSITIAERGDSNQQYHVFEDYSGTTIADLEHFEDGRLGSAVAYDHPTANNVHVLLDTLHIGSYGNPNDRWTEDAKQIYVNAIDWALSAGLGEIRGTVENEAGEPITDASVSIESKNLETSTNIEGAYTLGVGIGEYIVKAGAPGYEFDTKTVEVENLDDTVELNFVLKETDRASLSGTVTDDFDEGIEDVSITLIASSTDFEETITTDENGSYVFDDLVADDYEIVIEAKGYQTIKETITLDEGEHATKNYSLGEFDIAVIGDHKENITQFLNENDLHTQAREWDVTDDVYNYNMIIVNSNKGTNEQVEKLIEEADSYETSLVFVDTWGLDGSIKLLEEALGNLSLAEQGYDEGAVYANPLQDHEVFAGFEQEEIKIHNDKSPYATFKDYEGITLASLTVDEEDKGATMAYDFRGENHMHLLLSSYAVNNMIGPDRGWTEDGKDLFLSALHWAKEGEQELPDSPEWTTEGPIITNENTVQVAGEAEYRSTVKVMAGDDVLAETEPDADGAFEAELSGLADGHYDLVLRASNYKGDRDADETLELIVDTTDPELIVESPVDDLITDEEVIDVKGTATDDNLKEVLVNEEEVVVQDGAFETQLTLDEGTHTITITASDIAGNTTTEERTITVELEPFYTYPGGEIAYDDGTADNARAFYEAGNGWAVKMSLPEGKDSAMVTDGVFKFWDPDFPVPGGVDFQVEVWDATGTDGTPGEKLAGPFDAEALRDKDEWTVVDLSEHKIMVEDDFYMVYIQSDINDRSPGLATDETGPNAERSYQYVDGSWEQSPADEGNFMIRSRVAYEVEEPVITSPEEDMITNEANMTIEGTASPTTTAQLMNNGEEVDSIEIGEDGEFKFSTTLTEGDNEFTVVTLLDETEIEESESVSVLLDTIAPDLTIDRPTDGEKTNRETVTVEGTVSDEHLDYVEVNGQRADLDGDDYSRRILLDNGQNVIEVTAVDLAGNTTTESVTIDVKYDAPEINNLTPKEDMDLETGQNVKIEFDSEPGLRATFVVRMPLTDLGNGAALTSNPTELPMMEMPNGKYVGYWTVPANAYADGAQIEVKARDSYGNETREVANGKLFINLEK